MLYLSQSDDTLLRTYAAALDHDEVLLNDAVVREAAHRVDRLLGRVELGGTIFSVRLADAVDFFVDLCAMMVALLASTWNGPLHARRMPRTNASDLHEKNWLSE